MVGFFGPVLGPRSEESVMERGSILRYFFGPEKIALRGNKGRYCAGVGGSGGVAGEVRRGTLHYLDM